MFDGVENLAGGPLSYLIIATIVALDGFLPIFPGETAVITGGILAAHGDLSLPLVVAVAFAGALIGDNLSYLLGRTLGERAVSLLFRARKRVDQICLGAARRDPRHQVANTR